MTTTTAIPTGRQRAATPAEDRPKREREGAAWVFLSPWVLGAIVLTLLPMAVSLYLSSPTTTSSTHRTGSACATTRRCSRRTRGTGARSSRP